MKGFRICVFILVLIGFTVLIGCGGGSSDGVGISTNKQVKISTVKEMSETGISANEEYKAKSSSAEITIPANSISSSYDLSINKINTANLDSATLSYLKSYFGFDENVQFFSPIINFDISLVNNTSNIFRASINVDSDGFVLNNIAEILIKSDKVLKDWVNLHYYLAFCTESNGKWHFTPLKKEHFEKKLDQLCFKINKVGKLYVIIALPYEISEGVVNDLPEFTDTSTNTNTSTSSSTSTSTDTNTYTQTQTNTNTSTNTNTNTDIDTDIITGLTIYAEPDTLIASDSGMFKEDMKIHVGLEYSGSNPFELTTPSIEFLSFTPFDLGNSVKSNYQHDYYSYNYNSFISPESDINGVASFVLVIPTKNVKYDSNKYPENLFATAKFKSKANKDYESEPIKISFIYNSPIGKIPPSNLIVNTVFPNNSNYLNGSGSVGLSLTWQGDAMPFTANFKYNNKIIYSVASITENTINVNLPACLCGNANGEKYIEVEIVDSVNRSSSALSKSFVLDGEPPVLIASITNGSVFRIRDTVNILIISNKPVTDPAVSCEEGNAVLAETLASNTRFIYNLQLNSNFANGDHQIHIIASDTTEPAYFSNSGSVIATFTVDTSIRFPFANGSGTASDPFLIATAEDLNNIRYYPDYYYKQVADIDLEEFINSRTDTELYPSASDTNYDVGWLPIDGFSKLYDGDNYSINNFWIWRLDRNNVGLFGTLEEHAVIKNLKVNGRVYGHNYVGLIVGNADNQNTIDNCHVGNLDWYWGCATGTEYVGGIAGIAYEIINCSSICDLIGQSKVGGIVGQGKILKNCHFGGYSINNYRYSGISECIGGIAGSCIDGEISNCNITTNGLRFYSETSIDSFGGLVGYLKDSDIKDSNCNNSIEVNINYNNSISNFGGLVGKINGTNNKISNCFFNGNITIFANNIQNVGGIIGYNNCNGLEIDNSYSVSNCNFTLNSNEELYYMFGGIVGNSEGLNLKINRCLSKVNFNSNQNNFGTGICGSYLNGIISNCLSYTDSKSFGLIGLNYNYNTSSSSYNKSIVNSLAISNNAYYAGIIYDECYVLNISNCFVANDSSSANSSNYKRIANNYYINSEYCLLSNNYGWNTENVAGERLANNENGADAAKSEFWGASTQQSFWVNKLGWDFDNVWEFRNGCNLPQLRGMPSVSDPDYLVNAN